MGSDFLEPECKSITQCILPAIRASVAQQMSDRYGWKQVQIASSLGVAQVAVSKYLNRRYSPNVGKMERYLTKNKTISKLVEDMVKGKSAEQISREIDRLCEQVVQNI